MAIYELFFNSNQLGNFNTTSFTGGIFGSQNLTANGGHPGTPLVGAGVISNLTDITGWRLTVEGPASGPDRVVTPNAPMTIDYSTDGGATWHNYTAAMQMGDAVWYARQDEQGWMAIVADVPGEPDGQRGFIASATPVTRGQVFSTDETIMEPQFGEYALPCFAAGTLIATADGQRCVETLRRGDLVWTLDHGLLPVGWIGHRQVSLAEMVTNAKLRPIRIPQASLGDGLPLRDLYVSRQHRMMLRRDTALALLGTTDILVAAHHLTLLSGITEIMPEQAVTYVHLLFDHHEVVLAEGALSESLYIGAQAANVLGQEVLSEIETLFPDLLTAPPVPARPIPPQGKGLRRLVQAA